MIVDSRALVAILLREPGHERLLDERHAVAALSAWHRYGRGRHPVSLNYGDCLTYAVADVATRPLCCDGSDFPATDLDLDAT